MRAITEDCDPRRHANRFSLSLRLIWELKRLLEEFVVRQFAVHCCYYVKLIPRPKAKEANRWSPQLYELLLLHVLSSFSSFSPSSHFLVKFNFHSLCWFRNIFMPPLPRFVWSFSLRAAIFQFLFWFIIQTSKKLIMCVFTSSLRGGSGAKCEEMKS